MGEHLQSLNSPAFIDNNSKEPFDGPEFLRFSGTQGLAFRSKKAISFSETSVQNFQLVENFDIETGRYKVVMRALPKANPALITLIKDENSNSIKMSVEEMLGKCLELGTESIRNHFTLTEQIVDDKINSNDETLTSEMLDKFESDININIWICLIYFY